MKSSFWGAIGLAILSAAAWKKWLLAPQSLWTDDAFTNALSCSARLLDDRKQGLDQVGPGVASVEDWTSAAKGLFKPEYYGDRIDYWIEDARIAQLDATRSQISDLRVRCFRGPVAPPG
jgi:hypothetical protein